MVWYDIIRYDIISYLMLSCHKWIDKYIRYYHIIYYNIISYHNLCKNKNDTNHAREKNIIRWSGMGSIQNCRAVLFYFWDIFILCLFIIYLFLNVISKVKILENGCVSYTFLWYDIIWHHMIWVDLHCCQNALKIHGLINARFDFFVVDSALLMRSVIFSS